MRQSVLQHQEYDGMQRRTTSAYALELLQWAAEDHRLRGLKRACTMRTI